MGIVTETQQAIVVKATGERTEHSEIQDGCFSQGQLFLLGCDGTVYRSSQAVLSGVISIHSSSEHVICLSHQGIFGIGSNRFSQLAGTERYEIPVLIDHFSGLPLDSVKISCGPFHSAVVVEGTLYTFGLFKEGRLGWGKSGEDRVDLAVFLDDQGQDIDVNVVKVACGSCHTLVIDGNKSHIIQ